ncbi:MAG: hypothetical protein AABZ77_08610, partial [Chloroflexota bacterium]
MEKDYILKEIERTAKENNGKPLGSARFAKETGIKFSDWYGKYWARWSDAVIEAGYPPNKMNTAYDEETLFEQVIALIREISKFPTAGELRLKASKSTGFPGRTLGNRLGYSADLANKIITYCGSNPKYQDIIKVCKEKPWWYSSSAIRL